MCEWKADASLKMRNVDICNHCYKAATKMGAENTGNGTTSDFGTPQRKSLNVRSKNQFI